MLLKHPSWTFVTLDLAAPQVVQNAEAGLLTRTKRHEHISPVRGSFLWLLAHFRIDLKMLLLTSKAVEGHAPGYLSDAHSRAPRSNKFCFQLYQGPGWFTETLERLGF